MIITKKSKYKSKVYILEKEKIIYKLDCLCKDFQMRRIKRVGENADRKYFSTACKHLKPIVIALEKAGYKLKVPCEMEGSNKLTADVKRKVIERSNGICEIESCDILANRFHRIVRGSNGGKYTIENTRHLCEEHHKMIHAGEFK